MTNGDLGRQHRLAAHYLMDDTASGRLHATLELAAHSVGFPHAQVNVLDDVLQYTISDHHAGGSQAIPRSDTMCTYTINEEGVLAVDDLRIDVRSRNLPGVLDGHAASYLGVPLRGRESVPVGTLCFFDTEPRDITGEEQDLAMRFATIIEGQLELMRRGSEQRRLRDRSAELADAIEHDQIVPWFQPVVDLESGLVVGYEALARWQHLSGDMEGSALFVPLAEDSDLIVDLDRAVLQQALAHLARWRRSRPGLRLSINLSTRHLEIPDGVSFVHEAVLSSGLSPESVNIELTETRELAAEHVAHEAVALLRSHGYRVLLDDFGSGWSSLNWVLRLPVDGIKIDRAVTTALGSRVGDAVNRAVLGLARDLDLDVIVEGIDTAVHAEAARALGYRYAQGYYWSPPVPASAVDAGLDDRMSGVRPDGSDPSRARSEEVVRPTSVD